MAQHRWLALASVVIALGTCVASGLNQVYAQDPKSPTKCSAKDEKRAKEHFKRGEAHKTLKDYPAAVSEYLAGYEFCARPFLLFNVAQVHWLDGKLQAALEMYERYLKQEPDGSGAATARARFFQAADKSRQDGELERALTHYQRYLVLAPEGSNAQEAREQVQTLTDALAKRKADAERKAKTEREAEAARRERERARAARGAKRSSGAWKPWTTAGAGALAIAVGGVFHWRARSNGDEYDRQFGELCGTAAGCRIEELPPDVRSQLSTAQTQQGIAIGAYIAGGVALSAGLVWLMLRGAPPTADDTSQVSTQRSFLTPWAGPHAVGGSWLVHF